MNNLKLVNSFIVILSNGNNPRILNQDFLERNDIIPAGWKNKKVIVTPPFSQVEYEGFAVQMEENKVLISAQNVPLFSWEEVLPKVAIRFLKVLPHVAYTSVGLNFNLYDESITGQEAEGKLIDDMLTKGDWHNINGGLTGTLVDLQFRKSMPHFSIKVGVRETISKKEGQIEKKLEGFLVTINCHHDFEPKDVDERITFISKMSEYEKQMYEFVSSLPMFKQ